MENLRAADRRRHVWLPCLEENVFVSVILTTSSGQPVPVEIAKLITVYLLSS